jgi:hypothetical protein
MSGRSIKPRVYTSRCTYVSQFKVLSGPQTLTTVAWNIAVYDRYDDKGTRHPLLPAASPRNQSPCLAHAFVSRLPCNTRLPGGKQIAKLLPAYSVLLHRLPRHWSTGYYVTNYQLALPSITSSALLVLEA